MTAPTYGIIFNETTTAPNPVVVGDSSIVGLVLCQDDANTVAFPVGVPTLFNSTDPNFIGGTTPKIGATGDLAKAVAAINNQLGQFESAATIIVIPVTRPTGASALASTVSAIAAALPTLLQAGPQLGFIPRLIGCPGYTGYTPSQITNPQVGAGGTGYTSAPNVTFTPSGATATATISGGAVTGIQMVTPGAYAPGTTVTSMISGGGGTGATLTFTQAPLTNAVLAALPAVLQSLNATAFVADAGDGVQANSIAWRQLLSSDRLIPCDAYVVDPTGTIITDGVCAALGAQVAVDFRHQGLPGWSIAGQQILGIGGLKNYYPFSLLDGATQGQQLLANQISIIEAGVIGSDTAAASSGFVWQGVWNASTDPNKWFYNKRRMKDWSYLQLLKAMRRHLGVDNLTPQSVQNVLNDMVVLGSYLLSRGISIGFDVTFVASQTSPSNLQQGQFTVGFANETPAPINLITVLASDYYPALVVEDATLASDAATIQPEYIAPATTSVGG